MNEQLFQQIQLFKSVFKGREDVFAVQWEKIRKIGLYACLSLRPVSLSDTK